MMDVVVISRYGCRGGIFGGVSVWGAYFHVLKNLMW